MELSWLTKLKIGFVLAIGADVWIALAWSLMAPADPVEPVMLGSLSMPGMIVLPLVAFAVGFIAYFAAWPYGREVGILAVPAGLSVWGLRSGSMTSLMQATTDVAARQQIYSTLRWEPLFWLLLVGLGAWGAHTAARRFPAKKAKQPDTHHETVSAGLLQGCAAVILSLVIGHILIGAFVRGTPLPNIAIAVQSEGPQIAFGIWLAFAAAAFVVRHLLRISFGWTIGSIALLYIIITFIYGRTSVMAQVVAMAPATSFPHAIMGVMPIQLVAFGVLGAITGYWWAVRYHYWRKHECA
ncbi:hypothetical protein ACFL6U_28815 [Planctomycetota bacterium]